MRAREGQLNLSAINIHYKFMTCEQNRSEEYNW